MYIVFWNYREEDMFDVLVFSLVGALRRFLNSLIQRKIILSPLKGRNNKIIINPRISYMRSLSLHRLINSSVTN